MKKAKLLAVLVTLVLLCSVAVGILMTGTSAANGVTEYKVDGSSYASIKAALTAAASETWAKNESLVITVDPSKLAAESISRDASGTAYAGGIAFGQKTIFRADGTRLPITIKGSSDRTAFTLNITTGTMVACANSYTFENLTFPIGDTSSETMLFAGSGIVRLENVATGSGVVGKMSGDNFTARAFDGWTADKIAANAYTGDTNTYSSPKVHTSFILGNNVVYVHNSTKCNTAAVHDSDGWDAYSGVTLTPADTVAEIVLDGGKAGDLSGRVGTNPVAESIQRVEKGNVAGSYFASSGNFVNDTAYSGRTHYTGNITVIVNGGTIEKSTRLLHTAQVNGNYKVYFNGGTFNGYTQVGYGENVITGDYELNVTGGVYKDTSNGFYAHPCARIEGKSVVNISGGTFKHYFRGTHLQPYGEDGKKTGIKSIEINVMPNAESSDLDPVFENNFYGSYKNGGDIETMKLNISGGTFNGFVTNSHTDGVDTIINTITGGTFNGAFYSGKVTYAGVVNSMTNNVSGGTFNGGFYGAGMHNSGASSKPYPLVTNKISGGVFDSNYYGGGYYSTSYVDKIVNEVTGGTFNANYYGGSLNAIYSDKTVDYAITQIENKIGGGSFKGNFFGGQKTGTVNSIVTTVTKGTFSGIYYGGSEGDCAASITNKVSGGIFKNYFYGGSKASNLTSTTIVNEISGGTFEKSFLGGNVEGAVKSVTNKISGGTFEANFYGGSDGGTITSATTEVTKGTFNGIYYGGNYSDATLTLPITFAAVLLTIL